MSWQAEVVKLGARFIGWSHSLKNESTVKNEIAKRRKKSNSIPARLREKLHVEEKQVDGFRVYSVSPATGSSRLHVLYLHGGAYIHEMIGPQWSMVGRLVETLGCTFTVPLYPLAPEHSYKDTLAFTQKVYRDVITHNPKVILMGDSAGGGLCLSLMQIMKKEELPQPAHAVLLSPWLDVTLSHPKVKELQKVDVFLRSEGLRVAGKMYASDLDPKDPRISPLFGDLTGLAPLTVFMGSHDLLLYDARSLKEKAEAVGAVVHYHEYPRMFHVWMALHFLPESKDVFEKIKQLSIACCL